MGQHCGQLYNRVMDNMNKYGLVGLDRYMSVDERLGSQIGSESGSDNVG
jgi:hypothetical protein